MTPQLDPRFFPDIFEIILSSVDYPTLLRARLTSVSFANIVDGLLERGPLVLCASKRIGVKVFTQPNLWGGQAHRVPRTSRHSPEDTRAQAARNVRHISLRGVGMYQHEELNNFFKHVPYLITASIDEDRQLPRRGLNLPVTEFLTIDLGTACHCTFLSPGETRWRSFSPRAANIKVFIFDVDCLVCCDNYSRSFNLDCLISADLKRLFLSYRDAEQVLSQFAIPSATRSDTLAITVSTYGSYISWPEITAAFSLHFDIAEDKVHVTEADLGDIEGATWPNPMDDVAETVWGREDSDSDADVWDSSDETETSSEDRAEGDSEDSEDIEC